MLDRDEYVAKEIREGRCPFGKLGPGQCMVHCPLGFPGCGCADELALNPFLAAPSALRLDPELEIRDYAQTQEKDWFTRVCEWFRRWLRI